jgi:hypothetical protein
MSQAHKRLAQITGQLQQAFDVKDSKQPVAANVTAAVPIDIPFLF